MVYTFIIARPSWLTQRIWLEFLPSHLSGSRYLTCQNMLSLWETFPCFGLKDLSKNCGYKIRGDSLQCVWFEHGRRSFIPLSYMICLFSTALTLSAQNMFTDSHELCSFVSRPVFQTKGTVAMGVRLGLCLPLVLCLHIYLWNKRWVWWMYFNITPKFAVFLSYSSQRTR